MKLNGHTKPHVVILGGGFAGMEAAKKLRGSAARVTLLDRRNHYLFQPLLYQVATAVLNASDIAAPLRRIVRGDNISVLLAEATSIDLERKVVHVVSGEMPYDYLILATGATHSYFGHDDWEHYAPGLKTIEDALEVRKRILLAFEAAEREVDPGKRNEWLTFVVVGGGPTGVELAGALAEIARVSLSRDFRNFDPSQAKIILLEGLPRLLTAYPQELSERARRSLERLGVTVRTDARVTDVNARGVIVKDKFISARTVLWGAGVAASPLARTLGVPLDRAGRVRVTPTLSVPDHDEVFVVGDLALFEENGKQLPGIAPTAMQEGRHAAKNILLAMRGEPQKPFHYHDRGSFAVIGRGTAIGLLYDKFKMSGFAAWLAWLGIHIFYLVGFRNRVAVIMNWAYSFFTLRRNAQLITGDGVGDLPPLDGERLLKRPSAPIARLGGADASAGRDEP